MRSSKYFTTLVILFLIGLQVYGVIPERIGWWKFDNPSDLTAAEPGYGDALVLSGNQTAASGPEAGNGAVLIGPGSYYKMNHSIPANGGGTFVNEYSLAYDFKISQSGVWHSFFQTSVTNSNDADFFVNPSGNIGVAAVGYSNYSVNQDDWYRLVISVKNGSFFNCYLDGNLLMNGNIQTVDGRFALDKLLLIFADEDGEDGDIFCSELSIWNSALTAGEAKELGGYSHEIKTFMMHQAPYLQSPGLNSMTICWHDTALAGTKVRYGIDSVLNLSTDGSSQMISDPYRWHTVKLTGLQANTRYIYRVFSGSDSSAMYSFKTLPDTDYKGKIRFVLFSDTHASDTASAAKVLRAARSKLIELYGQDFENQVNGVFHSGDVTVSGSVPEQYSSQYFRPMSELSGNLPVSVVAGNHEGESSIFYNYLKLDDISAFPLNPALNEKIWTIKVGNSLFIGLNTNIIGQYGNLEANWLDSKLSETEADPNIDFVFIFFHHPPFSELWWDVSTFDGGPAYLLKVLFPVIKKYTKVQQLHTGHTHGFERGTIMSTQADGDFRIICDGGGGGPLDNWGSFTNYDYNDIHIAIDHFSFQILEIDIADHSWMDSMYSLGNQHKARNTEVLDTWYRKVSQPGPETPVAENAEISGGFVQFSTSDFSGVDSLMTVELQVIDNSDNSKIIVDSLANWKDIYGVDANYNPIDRHHGIDLYHLKISTSLISWNKSYSYHVRYRDHNLKWSEWSNLYPFTTVGIRENTADMTNHYLNQNVPNPFNESTIISYSLPEKSEAEIRVYDSNSRMVAVMKEGVKAKGTYFVDFQGENLDRGVYFYKLITDNFTATKKMIKVY